jgi:hypothetical protein
MLSAPVRNDLGESKRADSWVILNPLFLTYTVVDYMHVSSVNDMKVMKRSSRRPLGKHEMYSIRTITSTIIIQIDASRWSSKRWILY